VRAEGLTPDSFPDSMHIDQEYLLTVGGYARHAKLDVEFAALGIDDLMVMPCTVFRLERQVFGAVAS
jgi:hypothetical protein